MDYKSHKSCVAEVDMQEFEHACGFVTKCNYWVTPFTMEVVYNYYNIRCLLIRVTFL